MPASTEELNRRLADCPVAGRTWRHLGTGRYYTVIGRALIEATLEAGVVYQSREDSLIWVRPATEFRARFEMVS